MDVRAMIVTWPEDAPRGAVSRFVSEHGISRSRFYEIRARARAEGPVAAMAARPRTPQQPRHSQAISLAVEELAVRIRKDLADQGLDHGPLTVRVHLQRAGLRAPAASTLARLFARRGMVVPQPQKRPRSSYRRFSFAMAHECWQLDAFAWQLADHAPVAIFQLLDDHTRFLIASHVAAGERSQDAVTVVRKGIERFQTPCLLLTDNGAAFNRDRLGMRTPLVTMLTELGCTPITGRPRHPQTQGKDERVHATLQRWLRARDRADSITDLQHLVDEFDQLYNHTRPHQGIGLLTPAAALELAPHAIAPAIPQPTPGTASTPAKVHSLQRRVGSTGQISLHGAYVNLGMAYTATTTTVILTDTTAAIFDEHGDLIRSLVLVPGQTYYSNGRPRGAPGHNRPH
jgi:putative transposase